MAPTVERSAEMKEASPDLGRSSIDAEWSPDASASTVAWM